MVETPQFINRLPKHKRNREKNHIYKDNSGNTVVWTGVKCLKLPTLEKSFATCEKSAHWSSKNELLPEHVSKNSHQKFKFDCPDCAHEFSCSLDNIGNGSWCPFCGHQKLCDDENCESCFYNSFACNEKCFSWSDKNLLAPRDVFESSHKKFIFHCAMCLHDFSAALYCIVCDDSWCPFCASRKLCDDENCETCYDKSFASEEKSLYWSKTNKLQPRNVFKSSHKKFAFECQECAYLFQAALSNIVKGRWCSRCIHKTEKKLIQWFQSQFPMCKIISEYTTAWSNNKKTNYHYRYDIFLEFNNKKIIIELDGIQHFEVVKRFRNDPNSQRESDVLKMFLAMQNNHYIIRLLQQDVWSDTNNWEQKLVKSIQLLPSTPSCIYLHETKYAQHQKDLEALQQKSKNVKHQKRRNKNV
jgi:Probable Zinc-ribbon domain